MVQVMNASIPMDPDNYQGDGFEVYEDNKNGILITNGHDGNGIEDNGIEENSIHGNENNGILAANEHDDALDDELVDSNDTMSPDDNGFSVEFITADNPGPRSRKRKMDRPLKVKLTIPELPPSNLPPLQPPLSQPNSQMTSPSQPSLAQMPPLHQQLPESPERLNLRPLRVQQLSETPDSARKNSRPSRPHRLPERFTPERERRYKARKLENGTSEPDDDLPSILAKVLADGSPSRNANDIPFDEGELEIEQYTEEELDREIKRLTVRNLRAEVRKNTAQAKFFEGIDRKFGQILSVLISGGVDTKKELSGIKNLLARSLDINVPDNPTNGVAE